MDNRYGQYNADGTVTEPELSILTETRIFRVGSISEMVSPTVFVRYEGAYADRVTDDMRAEWRRGAPGASGKSTPSSKKQNAEETTL